MGFDPTPEQAVIVDVARTNDTFKVSARAGSGKTSTGVLIAEALPEKSIWYMAFNKPIAMEAERKYPRNTKASTAHSPAYRATMAKGMFSKDRLTGSIMPIVRAIEDDKIVADLREVTREADKQTARRAAFVTMNTLTKFMHSGDPVVGPQHVPSSWISRFNSKELQQQAREMAASCATKLWSEMLSRGNTLSITHDVYLKAWCLSEPVLPYDVIFFDEAQDANGVLLDLVQKQTHAQQVYVGDKFQQIYSWRGAINAMDLAPGEEYPLTTSFRFGPEIAGEANLLLRMLGEDLPITGAGNPGVVLDDSGNTSAEAILCRGNAGVLEETLHAIDTGKAAAVVGGTAETVKLMEAAYDLYEGNRTSHPEITLFGNWSELAEFAQTDDGTSMRPVVRTIEKYGHSIPLLCKKLQYETVKEDQADLVVSTAHKAKGREWDTVRFADDFGALVVEDDLGNPYLRTEEANLMYVSITRAKEELNLSGIGESLRADAHKLGAKLPATAPATGLQENEIILTPQDLRDIDKQGAEYEAPASLISDDEMAVLEGASKLLKDIGSRLTAEYLYTSAEEAKELGGRLYTFSLDLQMLGVTED